MVSRLFLIATLMMLLSGCGQSGPLYSPHPSKISGNQVTTPSPMTSPTGQ